MYFSESPDQLTIVLAEKMIQEPRTIRRIILPAIPYSSVRRIRICTGRDGVVRTG
ncbi:hypothetical protein [uncultured Hyphomonas sp.]|uniref:hypothetical protein n=1 Tax=uncultured Hyphomonas sp. TaxID=225298 RepID=UPI00374A964E